MGTRSYSCEITGRRQVALDGHFQCPNPACRFAAPMRVWGEGMAKRTVRSTPSMFENARPITEIPAQVKAEAKKAAEASAWAIAQQRYATVKCPRCVRGAAVAWVQFGGS